MDGACGTRLWNTVYEAGLKYGIGPGAPNELERIESGLFSYGGDARRQSHPASPFDMGLGKLVDLKGADDFVGKAALIEIARKGDHRRRVGLFVNGAPVSGSGHPLDLKQKEETVGIVSAI